VDGDLTVRAPTLLRGVVIVRGTTNVLGTGGDYVEVESDTGALGNLMTLMGQYRFSKSAYVPALTDTDGKPNEGKGKKNKGGKGKGKKP
jgi:hypothetical protein